MEGITKETTGLYAYYINRLSKEIPYFHTVSESTWRKSMFQDEDLDGCPLFQELITVCYRKNQVIKGFIQFGKSTYIFSEDGTKNFSKPTGIIRQCYFDQEVPEIGEKLVMKANRYFEKEKLLERFAFYHAFGMSHTAYHGKLFTKFSHVEKALSIYGYKKEHENIYYKRKLVKRFETKKVIKIKERRTSSENS